MPKSFTYLLKIDMDIDIAIFCKYVLISYRNWQNDIEATLVLLLVLGALRKLAARRHQL